MRELANSVALEGRLKSGECCMVKSNFGNVNCAKLGLFIGPNYKPKYRTAARNTLAGCIRGVLGLA